MAASDRSSERFDELRAGLRGDLLLAGDAAYDSARKLWNGDFDRHPLAIVRCRDTADVVAAVRLARARKIPLSVKAGGHGVAGTAVKDDALVVDLSPMRGVDVEPQSRTVRAQGGATWGDVDHATQLYGLAVPGGFVSTTGVGGFTLGGGIAWTSRKLGLACDNLLEAEVVTSEGKVLRASAKKHPDLLWALRGGGGNFGVVTSFRFRGQKVGPTIYGGFRVYREDRAPELLSLAARMYRRSPPEWNMLIVLGTAPPAPFLPREVHGKRVAIAACCYLGPVARGPRVAREFLAVPEAVADHVGPMPYLALQTGFDALQPAGMPSYWKSTYATALPPEAIAVLVERWRQVPSPLTELHFQYFGGAVSRIGALESAVGNRSAPFLFNLIGKWEPGGDRERNVRYIRELWDALQPYSTGGVYVNFLSEQSQAATEASYGRKNFERLRRIKRKYDPSNVFQGSHPISPK